eukprot:5623437-Pyramimonas_sp.AAC.1
MPSSAAADLVARGAPPVLAHPAQGRTPSASRACAHAGRLGHSPPDGAANVPLCTPDTPVGGSPSTLPCVFD